MKQPVALYGENGIEPKDFAQLMEELSKPFPATEVRFRIGPTGGGRGMVLSYIDSRLVMDRLDALCGPFWKVEYESHPSSKGLLCTIYIKIGGEWIGRSDGAGVGRGTEGGEIGVAEKGALTDALKRAAVAWGIGRELYAWPSQWVKISDGKYPKILECPTFPAEIYTEEEIKTAVEAWNKENGVAPRSNSGSGSTSTQKRRRPTASKKAEEEKKEKADPAILARAGAFEVPADQPMAGVKVQDLNSSFLRYFAGVGKNSAKATFSPSKEEEVTLQAAAKYWLEHGVKKDG